MPYLDGLIRKFLNLIESLINFKKDCLRYVNIASTDLTLFFMVKLQAINYKEEEAGQKNAQLNSTGKNALLIINTLCSSVFSWSLPIPNYILDIMCFFPT